MEAFLEFETRLISRLRITFGRYTGSILSCLKTVPVWRYILYRVWTSRTVSGKPSTDLQVGTFRMEVASPCNTKTDSLGVVEAGGDGESPTTWSVSLLVQTTPADVEIGRMTDPRPVRGGETRLYYSTFNLSKLDL